MSEYVKVLERVLIFGDRIKAIEKKQAERFPMLVEKLDRIEGSLKSTAGRVGRMENSFPTLVDRIDAIEKKQAERFPMLVGKLDKLEDDISKLTKTVYNIKRWTS